MKRHTFIMTLVAGGMAMAMLSACHRSNDRNTGMEEQSSFAQVNSENIQPEQPDNLVDIRRPDVKIHVKRGQTLAMQTEGLTLTAVDAAVQHEADYSITSLVSEDLPPLPQGMMNMTAATAGYRLLPGGEHFLPYAELRMTYDPERIPEGYSPEDIYTSFYDTATLAWVRLERVEVDTLHHEIVSLTTHFTDFINELLKSPEMPETQAFVPTAMSSLEAANPLAGYSTIAPPVANNMGTASLTYPIQVPAGRGGMQPNLALTYNSNGGNGLCGMGWDLQIPCISVETRWGVPLYDPQKESETYLINGEQLLTGHNAMPTFAKEFEPRDSNFVKRFYPRVEGAFDSILRYGNSPQTYWWEVYDRSGTRYIYGLGDGELRSLQQNAVAKWYLTRVIDRNGNTIRYQYKTYRSGADGAHSGTAIYLDKISYTAYYEGIEENPWYGYGVSFHYNIGRNDPVITGNYGVKENVCMRLAAVKTWYVKYGKAQRGKPLLCKPPCLSELDRIPDPSKLNELWGILERVKKSGYNEEYFISRFMNWDSYSQIDSSLIRGYRLLYTESTTGKSLLSAVVEMSPDEWGNRANDITAGELEDGSVLKYHRFNYRAPRSDAFGQSVLLTTEIEGAESGLSSFAASPLGGSKSSNDNYNFSVGVGLGCDPTKRTFNIEGSGSFTPNSVSEGTTSLIDLNGDGYPDLLYKKSGEWRCQLFSPQSNLYRSEENVYVSLPTDGFSKSITKDDYSIGLGAHVGWEYKDRDAGVNVGAQHTYSTSENTMYFADVNADHKPDIVKDGIVWFNNSHDDSITFGREFRPHTDLDMPCEISYFAIERSEGLDYSIFEEGHQTTTYVSWIDKKDQDISTLVPTVLAPHNMDTLRRSVVRVWVAPEGGEIQITGTAMLDSTFAVARERTNADGVHVSLQHNDSILPGTAHDLTKQAPQHDMSIAGVSVEQGDRIYFRVEALENDLYDVVNWEPVISYKNRNLSHVDNTGRPFYIFNAKDDFLAWKDERFSIPQNGEVRVSANGLYNGNFSHGETITLMIIKADTSDNNPVTIKQATLNSSNTSLNNLFGGVRLDTIIALDTTEILYFKAESSMPVDWTKLRWFPHITSESFDNGDSARFTILDGEGHTLKKNVIDIFMSPILPKEFLDFGTTNVPVDTAMFGNINHCWGNFIYNSNTMRTAIDESKIVKDSRYQRSQVENIGNDINNTYGQPVSAGDVMPGLENLLPNPDQADASSLEAMYEPGKTSNRILVGFAGRNYVTPTQMGLYNWYSVQAALGDSTLLLPVTNQSIAASGLTAVGPVKETYQHGFGVHASGGLSFSNDVGIGACVNYSNGMNSLTADFVDFNGDGYPDVISETDAIYTNPWGGLSAKKAGINPLGEQGIYNSVYNAYSLQGGASYACYKKTGKTRGTVHIQLRSEQAGLSANGDGSVAKSDDHAELVWMDVNGDGLPDCLDDEGHVAINLGYDFYYHNDQYLSSYAPSGNGSICYNGSASLGVGGASDLIINNNILTTVNHSFTANASGSKSINSGKVMYVDMNGDGLVDKIADENKLYYNTGWGFVNTCQTLDNGAVSEDMSHCSGYSGNITLGVPMYFLGCFKLQGSAGLSSNNTAATTQTMLLDMNGDGLPDLVRQGDNETSIDVKYNQLYDVDKLTDVQSFYGNHIEIEYAQADYSAGAQQRPTVMKKLTVRDLTGKSGDKRVFGFGYKYYMHSIEERTPYGFDSVIVTQYLDNTPYRITRQHYRTDHYKMRGMKASELVTDASGHPYVENAWVYELKRIDNGTVVPLDGEHCDSATWPAMDSVITRYYDPASRAIRIETAERYVHADSGRVVRYNKHNNIAVINTDDVFCTMTYTRKSKNQSALPADVKVKDARGNLLRHRFAEYDNAGHLIRLTLDGDSQLSVSEYGYDSYGNTEWFRGPENAIGQRVKISYTYDSLVHMFPTITEDSAFGDRSRVEYDVRLGLPLRVYSIGGDSISYTYDGWGRPRTIRAYQERNTNKYPTIRYRYWDGNDSDAPQINLPRFRTFTGPSVQSGKLTPVSCEDYNGWPIWAQTLHRSQQDDSLAATTILFADGHGRVLQTKKTAVINGNPQKVVSGHVVYDDAGRPAKAYEPFVSNLEYCEYHTPSPGGVVTQTSYDILDRVVENRIQIDSDTNNDIVTRSVYGFYRMGTETCFLTTTTDPEGRQSKTITNARGLTTRNIDAEGGVTAFAYDAVGQLTSSIDPDLFQTTYTYDRLGRLSRRDHPDAGTTRYTYDPAGNMILETNPLGQIQYIYNYQRLTEKKYSNLTQNNVLYEYGTVGRNCGRVTKVTDGSGVQSFDYDAMGNVSKSVRMLSVPAAGYAYTFSHSYVYDSWGRMQAMTYPDGEQIRYRYNSAGDLVRMTGKKGRSSRPYIDTIRYNLYGQRTYIHYGNGTSVSYKYDSLQRLCYLESRDGSLSHLPMQQIAYEFDQVGNITLLHNDAPANGSLGGSYTNKYQYDKLNRLIWADGTGMKCEFNMDMQYTQAGRLGFKHQKWSVESNQKEQKMQYAYPASELSRFIPCMHAPRMIMDQNFGNRYVLQWDGAGNLNQISYVDRFGLFNSTRHLAWTEDNRLYTVADERYYSYYAYDHTGQRTLKMTGDASTVDVNAWEQHTYGCLDHVTLYPSPYMVLTEQGYTKHYYAGTERVAARLGSGGLSYDATCVTANGEVAKRSDELFWKGVKLLNGRGNKPEDFKEMSLVDAKGNEVDWHKKIDLDKLAMSWQLEAKLDPWKIHSVIDDNSYPAMPGNTRYENEPDVYFYHSDHLGGASWITDVNGKPVQHLQYLPFGEPYVNQHSTGYQERFTFTGKERDEETGYGYFGARYMDYTLMTSFISVDRYASKYPFISPYAYCAWNPIMLTDPTGDTIFNAYEAYKDVSQEIQRLTEMKEQESGLFKLFKRWSINNKIRNLKKNNLKYQKVQGALDAFKETNPEEYNRLDQLSSYGKKVNIIVGADLDKTHSPNGAEGTTDISFLQDKNTGDILGVSLFRITLYRSAFFPPSNGLAALANEMGDVIFATVKPQDAYLGLYGVKYEYKSYWKNASSQFSFAYEYYILNPNKHPKPNPYEY